MLNTFVLDDHYFNKTMHNSCSSNIHTVRVVQYEIHVINSDKSVLPLTSVTPTYLQGYSIRHHRCLQSPIQTTIHILFGLAKAGILGGGLILLESNWHGKEMY